MGLAYRLCLRSFQEAFPTDRLAAYATIEALFTSTYGQKNAAGQTFTYGTNKVGGFHFSPGTNHTSSGFSATSGLMTITSVSDNGNGTFNIGFNGSATDSLGCTVSASGRFLFHSSYDTVPGG